MLQPISDLICRAKELRDQKVALDEQAAKLRRQRDQIAAELAEVEAELASLIRRLQKKVLKAKRHQIFERGQEALLKLPIEEYKARMKYKDLSALSLAFCLGMRRQRHASR